MVAVEMRSNIVRQRPVPVIQRGRPLSPSSTKTQRSVGGTRNMPHMNKTMTKIQLSPGHLDDNTHTVEIPAAVWADSIFPISNSFLISVCQSISRLNVRYYQHSPSLFCSDCLRDSTGEASNNYRPVFRFH